MDDEAGGRTPIQGAEAAAARQVAAQAAALLTPQQQIQQASHHPSPGPTQGYSYPRANNSNSGLSVAPRGSRKTRKLRKGNV